MRSTNNGSSGISKNVAYSTEVREAFIELHMDSQSKKSDLIHEYTAKADRIRVKAYDTETYQGMKEKLEDKLELQSYTMSLITFLVLVKDDYSQFLYTHGRDYSFSYDVKEIRDDISEAIGAYRGILYALSGETSLLKDMIYVKSPEHRRSSNHG